MSMFDAHAHLCDPRFDQDREQVLARARQSGVTDILSAGVGPSRRATWRALAHQSGVHLAAGIHPYQLAARTLPWLEQALAEVADDLSLARAVGETGLDRSTLHRDSSSLQETSLRAHLALARERDLPIVLHVVRATGRVLELLRADGPPRRGGMVHAFAGPRELVSTYQELGFYLSVGGAIARGTPSRRLLEAVRSIHPERLLVETDAPDRPPDPPGGRGEPALLGRVVEALAAVCGVTKAKLAHQTAINARRFLGLPS